MEYIKVDTNTMKVTDTKTEEFIYPYENLLSLKAELVKDKETYNNRIDKKIAKYDVLIAEAGKLGIKAKLIEPKVM